MLYVVLCIMLYNRIFVKMYIFIVTRDGFGLFCIIMEIKTISISFYNIKYIHLF